MRTFSYDHNTTAAKTTQLRGLAQRACALEFGKESDMISLSDSSRRTHRTRQPVRRALRSPR